MYLDVYGFLINYVHPMELVAHRKRYYQCLITAVLEAIGVPMSRIRFVDESTYVYTKEFMIDFQKLCALMEQQDARDTTQEVAETSMLSPLLCSVHQALSEQYMDMDIQFGGEDQVSHLKSTPSHFQFRPSFFPAAFWIGRTFPRCPREPTGCIQVPGFGSLSYDVCPTISDG